MMRSSWIGQELIQTFEDQLPQITLSPSSEAGIFKIYCDKHLIWDRKIDQNALDIKVIKQRVRDRIAPDKELGHTENVKGDTK
jgi:selenoprotein W-related protein